MGRKALLWGEFAVLFVGVPLGILLRPCRIFLIPFLLASALGCLLYLIARKDFKRESLWNWRGGRAEIKRALLLFLIFGGLGLGLVWIFEPEQFLSLPMRRPALWGAVMLLYPLLSVYPQELIYREFMQRRYEGILGSGWGFVLASSISFSYMHMLFWNWLAVALTLAGGLLFSYSYMRTRSLALCSIEHSLYGCLVFTAGIGESFLKVGTLFAAKQAFGL